MKIVITVVFLVLCVLPALTAPKSPEAKKRQLNSLEFDDEVLEHFDTDSDGVLNIDEFTEFYHHLFEGKNTSGPACHTEEKLFIDFDANQNNVLEMDEIHGVSLQQLLMVLEGCAEPLPEEEEEEEEDCADPDSWESWLAGLASTFLVSVVALVGILLIPAGSQNSFYRNTLMYAMISFAVGALIGDAVLHIIPEIYGEAEGDETTGVSCVILLGVLFFFITEKALHFIFGHTHSHGVSETDVGEEDEDTEPQEQTGKWYRQSPKLTFLQEINRTKSVKPYGWLNLMADAIHNALDGIAIGAAYSNSLSVGIATTLAVVFHEIPQELGDFSLLVKAGFSKPGALFFNFVTGLTAMVGCIIGLAIGESSQDADMWLLSITAGGFFYIALGDMVPELNNGGKTLLDAFVQVVGIATGFSMMYFVLLIEPELEEDCGGGHSHEH